MRMSFYFIKKTKNKKTSNGPDKSTLFSHTTYSIFKLNACADCAIATEKNDEMFMHVYLECIGGGTCRGYDNNGSFCFAPNCLKLTSRADAETREF